MKDLFIETHDLFKILLLREILNIKLYFKGINFEKQIEVPGIIT